MRLTYVTPRPELGGGAKVVFQHAGLLRAAGHDVTVLGEGPLPEWSALRAPYVDYSAALPAMPSQDLVIATFFPTVAVAERLGCGPIAHLCQGYEGALIHLRPRLREIEAVYARPLPTLAVTPALAEFLHRRFGRESRVVSPCVDPLFRPVLRWRPRRPAWIAVPGIFEAEIKGVPTALAALRELRRETGARLLRFSILPLSAEERGLLEPDRYLCHAAPPVIARALRRMDLLLFPSREGEGFGLPLLEALASGVPAVASSIAATRYFASGAAELVAEGDAAAMASAAGALLGDPRRWRRQRRLGFAAAARFRPERVAPELDAAVAWAAQTARQGGRP